MEHTCDTFLKYKDSNTAFYLAFGNNEFQLKWIQELEINHCLIASFIHLSAYISSKEKLV